MNRASENYIERAIAYFRDVDSFDIEGTMRHMTENVVMEVPTHGVRKEGIDEVRRSYASRAEAVTESWHGNFEFIPHEETKCLAIRLAVKRVNADGSKEEMDNFTLLHFDGDLICSVAIWMSGNNSLT